LERRVLDGQSLDRESLDGCLVERAGLGIAQSPDVPSRASHRIGLSIAPLIAIELAVSAAFAAMSRHSHQAIGRPITVAFFAIAFALAGAFNMRLEFRRHQFTFTLAEAVLSASFFALGPIGVGADPSDVYTVHYKNLAAVVSDAPLEVLDSTRENVLAHERVNETVMHEHTVIPMSFGTIFKTREDIVELLRSAAEAFGDVLNKMQNKLEFGLKVLWDRDQAVREVENDDEDISRLKKEISGQKGPTYFARMQYGRLVDSALQQRSERYVADILDQLRDVSVASRVNKPIGDKMIMNAAFLISRERENAFDAKVKSIASRFDKLTFKYTGPWPPYNFVNIRLKLERA